MASTANGAACARLALLFTVQDDTAVRVFSSETLQPRILAHVAPGNQRELAARRDPQGNLLEEEEAHIYYTCDEWPPASWIQGGTGAYTRCAAMRCQNVGVYAAEQNFQGDSHNALRDVMLANVERTLANRGVAFDSARHVGLLRFRTTN